MRKKRVLLDYSGLNDDQLSTLTGRVLDCLDGHALFTDLPVTAVELEEQLLDFRARWQQVSPGGSTLGFAEKNDARGLLLASLKDIAFYVNKMANGSRSMLLSSGLTLEADPKPVLVPRVVTGAVVVDGLQRSQLVFSFDSLKEALFYEYQVADSLDADGIPEWGESFRTSVSRSNVYAPTVPGVTYYFRVRATNKKGDGDWSETVSLMAR